MVRGRLAQVVILAVDEKARQVLVEVAEDRKAEGGQGGEGDRPAGKALCVPIGLTIQSRRRPRMVSLYVGRARSGSSSVAMPTSSKTRRDGR